MRDRGVPRTNSHDNRYHCLIDIPRETSIDDMEGPVVYFIERIGTLIDDAYPNL
jgi:hypothetical protein